MKNLHLEITKKFSSILVSVKGQLEAKNTNDLINALPHLINERHDLIILDLRETTNIDLIATEALHSAQAMLKSFGGKLDIISREFYSTLNVLRNSEIENQMPVTYTTDLQIAC